LRMDFRLAQFRETGPKLKALKRFEAVVQNVQRQINVRRDC
jgi:hypothetical protein